jgi:hypothetical protein
VPNCIHLQVGDAKYRVRRLSLTALEQGPDARQQLRELVRTQVETPYLVAHL